MGAFEQADLQLPKSSCIDCHFFEHNEEVILKITLSGRCPYGSRGENYGDFLYTSIGLALLTYKPLAVLIDMRELCYDYGDPILNLFHIFDDVRPFGEDKILTAFVLSDKNKYGLSSLIQVSVDNPKPPFFNQYEKASDYLFHEYDKI